MAGHGRLAVTSGILAVPDDVLRDYSDYHLRSSSRKIQV